MFHNDETWHSLLYLRKIQKIYRLRDTPLIFCWHQYFFIRNQQFLLYWEIQIILKTIFFCLLPRLNLTPHSADSKAESNQVKCQKVLVFKTFSTCCYFLLYIVCFFSLFIEVFFSMFLSFMISLIKNFVMNDSDRLEL